MFHPRRLIATSVLAGLISTLSLTGQEKETGLVFKGHTDAVYSVAQTPDGKLLVTGGFDRTVRVWDAVTGKQLRSLGGPTGHQSLVLSVATSPSGELMASGGSDNALYLWDVPLRTHLRQFAHNAPVVSASLSADGKTLAGLGTDGSVRTWQNADGKTLRDIPAVHCGGLRGQLSANGQQYVTASDDGFVWYT